MDLAFFTTEVITPLMSEKISHGKGEMRSWTQDYREWGWSWDLNWAQLD